jgi:hypothetical protein
MRPIGKGACFRVLTGDLRGRLCEVVDMMTNAPQCVVSFGAGDNRLVSSHDLAGSGFQRLDDSPKEVDPTAEEVLAAAIALRRLYHDRSQSDDAYGGASEAFWKRIDALGGKEEDKRS